MRKEVIAAVLVLCAGPAFAESCGPDSRPGDTCNIAISFLHPTQPSAGMIVVGKKIKILRDMGAKEFDGYKKKNPCTLVIGGGAPYIVDRHHLALALSEVGERKMPCVVLANMSGLSERAFWREMEKRRWVYLRSADGSPITPKELPETLAGLRDDPWRSLAWGVREAEGYDKTDIPFAEFEWADFFRPRVDADFINSDFKKAVRQGVKLAGSSEAQHLPGFKR